MVSINRAFNEIVCKLVYYGPGMCGKTTNLEVIHDQVPDSNRGDLVSLATETDRTLFFDYLPIDLGTVNGMKTKFQMFTVPGQVFYNATRKLVLRGVDGIVFVADSQRSRIDENRESLLNLRENLAEYGYDLETIPWILQYNKRDLPDAMPIEELEAALNPGVKYIEAVALQGQGVRETLKYISTEVLKNLRRQMDEESKPKSDLEATAHRRQKANPMAQTAPSGIPMPSAKALAGQGVEVPDDLPVPPPPPVQEQKKKNDKPPLRIIQKCDARWHGMKVGTARIELRSNDNSNGSRAYELSGEVVSLGMFTRPMGCRLRHIGDDTRELEARSVPFMVFSDEFQEDGEEPVEVLVKNAMDKNIYIRYKGWGGAIVLTPEGKPSVF